MKNKLSVWLFSDEFASLSSTQEEEYDEMEKKLTELLPDVKLRFSRGKQPQDLANASPDVYVFDIGGMCYVDYGGIQRRNWCHMVLRQLEDHPNTLFIPWTSMTGDSLQWAIEDFMPEAKNAANIWLPNCGMVDWWEMPGLQEKLRSWL